MTRTQDMQEQIEKLKKRNEELEEAVGRAVSVLRHDSDPIAAMAALNILSEVL